MNKRLLIVLASIILIIVGSIFILIKSNNDNHTIISKINLAIENDNIKQVKKLVKDTNINQVYTGSDCHSEDSDNYYCVTPLSMACIQGNYEIVKFLVESGADINFKEDDYWYNGNTPLIFAVESNNKDKYKIIKYLLDNGADKYIKTTKSNRTALDIAKLDNDKELIELLS